MVIIDTVAKDTMADIPPNYAALYRVDAQNTIISRFVCPVYEINTYEGLKAVIALLWPLGSIPLCDTRNFQVMTPGAYIIHEKYWDNFYSQQKTKIFHIRF